MQIVSLHSQLIDLSAILSKQQVSAFMLH